MAKPHHHWPRFWVPLGKTIPLDDQGFLLDPESEYAHFYYAGYRARALAQLNEFPVTILLGEPGVGKSTTLEEEASRLRAAGEACLYRELNQYHSDSRLIGDIFDSEEIQAWKQGSHPLTLLLDSLDECSLTIPAAARILLNQLKKLPTERLALRLTCRTADWPESFTGELRALWRGENSEAPDPVGIFELAPLRSEDIRRAAQDRGLDAAAFLKEIRNKEIQPLASHPNTLNMLLGLSGRPDGLPRQRAELYRLGCETLADESSPFRQESRYTGKLAARQRMAIAARIAAQMVFGHRSAIWRGNTWEAETADLIESEITGDVEQADGLDFPVDAPALRETLECALFSGRGEKRIGFSHQSYAEFLAAWHLHSHSLGTQRALALLLHPDDGRVPPQHAETAIWLAALDRTVFSALVETEPLLLLRTDLSDTSDNQKTELTQALLGAFANRTEFDMDWGLRQHYRKLAHPGLMAQLRPLIADSNAAHAARRAAMDIASACNVHELAEDLIVLALDQEEEYQQRLNAAYAATELASEQQLARLRPLALGEAGDDPEDQLKAVVVPALWPKQLSTQEIFDLLSQTRNARCLGKFRYLPEKFAPRFTDNDLIIALHWTAEIGDTHDDYEAQLHKDAIMAEAWKRLDAPDVRSAFVETAWACLDRHERVFNRRGERDKDWLEQDAPKRRQAALALLEGHSATHNTRDPISLIVGENAFILPQDNHWLLEHYQASTDPALRANLAKCIDFFVRWDAETAWLNTVIDAACVDATHSASPLADTVAPWMEPIWFGSDTERTLKERDAKQKRWQQRHPLPLAPPPPARVEQALEESEAGKTDAWMRLWQELSLPDDATYYGWRFDAVTKFPGWLRANHAERERILRCAEAWLTHETLAQEEIFRTDNSTGYQHTSSYLALRLLADEASAVLAAAPAEKWRHWAEIIVAFPFDQDSAERNNILKLAYAMAPDAVLTTFRRLIGQEIDAHQSPSRARELAAIWAEPVAALLREFLAQPGLTPDQTSVWLEMLLEHGDETAFDFARDIVAKRPAMGPPNQPLALAAARKLLAHQTQKAWPFVWEAMLTDAGFGERLMLELAHHGSREGGILVALAEPQVTDLYFWLEEHFPPQEDAYYPSGQAHSVTPRDTVARIRDNCPAHLSRRGTQPAIDALDSICARQPDRDWLKHLLNEAKQAYRKATLSALSPAELIAYTHRKDARLARSSAELMAAVLVSLQRLQQKLHGQTPLAPFLWDLADNGKSGRPKSEDRLSDFVKHHLECDLPTFVIDREVQIQNLKEHGIGERTDLKIEAKDAEGRSLSVIIESKGCWNKELMTAMESQLAERYLKLAAESCGIYLVGWFRCERLADKYCVFPGTKEELSTTLNGQAQELSKGRGNLSAFVLDASY